MTRKKQLKMFENTILNEEHTRRYTLGGVVGLEKQISNLSTVCLENSNTISHLQTQLREAMELLELAVEDMKKSSVCDCCKNGCQGDDICIDNGYMNFYWQHDDKLKELGIEV